MKVYVFNEQQLEQALAEWQANETEELRKVDERAVREFLASDAAARQKMWMTCNPKILPAMDPADIKEPKRGTGDQLAQP